MMSDYERGRYTASQGNARNSRSTKSSSSGRSSASGRNSYSSGSSGRTRTSSSSRGTRGRSSRPSSGNRSSQRSSSYRGRSGYGRSSYSGRRNRRHRNPYTGLWVGLVSLVAVVAVVSMIFAFQGKHTKETESETEVFAETSSVPETELEKKVMVDNITITGMSRDAAKAAILKEYPWAMQVQNGEELYSVANLMETKVDALLDEIFMGEPRENYTLDTHGLEEAIAAQAAAVAQLWDKKAKNGSISSFDKDANKFVFSGSEAGIAVDQEKLIADISDALDKKEFSRIIPVTTTAVQPEFDEATAKEKYKTVSTFTTNSTANSKRNTNIKLACQAINGTVLQPGEEFSFNDVVGQRTEEKGYQPASAYNSGEVVQEIGGGVCQVSTTLYNAVLRAGLKTTTRRAHTYEPSYVTPGMDATVSYGGPDYKFVNNSSTAIGIRASYSDQVVTVSIYAIPILEEGVKYTLKSTKIKDTDIPDPVYEEDPTLQPNVEKVKSAGTQGSYWEIRLVITKDGEVISDEADHHTTYKGHAPVVLRNTSGVVVAPEHTEPAPSEVPIASEGAADGFSSAPAQTEESNVPESPANSATTAGNANRNETTAGNTNRSETTAGNANRSETTAGNTNRSETTAGNTNRNETSRSENSTAVPSKPAEPSQPVENSTTVPAAPTAPTAPTTPTAPSASPTQGNTPGAATSPNEGGPGYEGPGNPAEIVAPNPLGA